MTCLKRTSFLSINDTYFLDMSLLFMTIISTNSNTHLDMSFYLRRLKLWVFFFDTSLYIFFNASIFLSRIDPFLLRVLSLCFTLLLYCSVVIHRKQKSVELYHILLLDCHDDSLYTVNIRDSTLLFCGHLYLLRFWLYTTNSSWILVRYIHKCSLSEIQLCSNIK